MEGIEISFKLIVGTFIGRRKRAHSKGSVGHCTLKHHATTLAPSIQKLFTVPNYNMKTSININNEINEIRYKIV